LVSSYLIQQTSEKAVVADQKGGLVLLLQAKGPS
jgi:hypothetical protein